MNRHVVSVRKEKVILIALQSNSKETMLKAIPNKNAGFIILLTSILILMLFLSLLGLIICQPEVDILLLTLIILRRIVIISV